jgi:multidrug efflux pump subunit AcrA (membrane-fusion protein)
MALFSAHILSPKWSALAAAATLLTLTTPAFTADEDSPKGEAVTVIKATKAYFASIVEVSGTVMAREEIPVRPDRMGLKVADVLAEAGESVQAGQTLARLTSPEGGTSINVTAPQSGVILSTTAVIGGLASAKGEALFTIIKNGDYDVMGMVPAADLARLSKDQPASVRVNGTGEIEGRVSRVAPTVLPDVQLGQVFIALKRTDKKLFVNAAGRALIKTGQSYNIAVPLSAVQYDQAGTVVKVVKRGHIGVRRVETGLMSGGQIEIKDGLTEGDDVVARAGALLREDDPVRPVEAAAMR